MKKDLEKKGEAPPRRVKTTIVLEKNLLEVSKIVAISFGVDFSDLVAECLRSRIEAEGGDSVAVRMLRDGTAAGLYGKAAKKGGVRR